MWFPHLSTVVRVYRRVTNTHRRTPVAREGLQDAQWWYEACQQASADVLAGASDLRRELEPQLGRWQTPRAVWFDQERGSLLVVLHDGLSVAVATDDTLTAPALAAAAELGGLQLRLSLRATGVLQVHAIWESWHGVVEGIPAASSH